MTSGKEYSFPKAKLEDDWELIGDDSQVVGKSMSTEYRLISTMGERDWSVDTYAKYSTQDGETNTTTYQIKTVFWSGIAGLGDGGVQVNDGIYTSNIEESNKDYDSYWIASPKAMVGDTQWEGNAIFTINKNKGFYFGASYYGLGVRPVAIIRTTDYVNSNLGFLE